ncbi:MAG: nucleotidyltransferase [Spirochaetales bacterium]|nr:nucleotidyltransferase [Spirochaetales bacterium]
MLAKLKTLKHSIIEVAGVYHARNVRIFGSALTRDDPGDVDILVEMNPDASLLDEIALQDELSSLLKIKVDLVSEQGLSPYIKDAILRTAQPL